jgi:sugar phosphate isomerase/epimerase
MNAKIGLQLYSVRSETDKDFLGTLRKVAEIGYAGVEFAGGIRQVASLPDLKWTLSETNLEVAGAVFAIDEMESDIEGIIAFCKEIGCATIINPWVDESLRQTEDGYRAVAQKLNGFGKQFQQAGIQFLYHVHGFEFAMFGDKTGMEVLMETFDPRYVNLEIDVYWVEHAGVDAVEFMQKYGFCSPSIHFKDMKDREIKMDVEVGNGCINMRAIAKIGKQNQAGWFIVEQEQFEMPALESVTVSLHNLKQILTETN